MALLDIITAPDPRLKIVCRPVSAVDDDVRRLMSDMLETMYAAPGIGLSAPQVGDSRRVLVVDVSRDGEARQPFQMADPKILEAARKLVVNEEGCLSFPDQYSEVSRPEWVRISYLDDLGQAREVTADGLLAVCLQHEIDHLDGTLFVDHLTLLKRGMILRKMKKSKRLQIQEPVD
ncbi:MAG: peptide deformylase [Alphaproteobacteria bacterium]|nr:peptide deformylase [Alphaproteobacteria bacterium]